MWKNKQCLHRRMFVLTQTVCIPALQTPPSGQADLWELAPGKPGSIAVPVSWLVAPKPFEQVETLYSYSFLTLKKRQLKYLFQKISNLMKSYCWTTEWHHKLSIHYERQNSAPSLTSDTISPQGSRKISHQTYLQRSVVCLFAFIFENLVWQNFWHKLKIISTNYIY